MAAPHVWRLPGVGSRESLAGRVAGYAFTNLCGLPAPAAQPDGALHKAQHSKLALRAQVVRAAPSAATGPNGRSGGLLVCLT